MNQITISTLAWKRPEVFEMWCENISNLKPKPNVVIAGSEGDQCKEIAIRYGFTYVQTQNKLLGAKANVSALLAKETECTHVMLTGSDDIISQTMWEFYVNWKGETLALSDYYFYNMPDGRMIYWGGYTQGKRIGEPIGACKMLSREIMDKIEWKPFNDNERQPDEHTTELKLKKIGVYAHTVKTSMTGGLSIDLKSETNMNKFSVWNNSKYVVPIAVISEHPDLLSLFIKHSKSFRDKLKMAQMSVNRKNR